MSLDLLHTFNFVECSLLFAVLYGISSLNARSSKEGEKYLRGEGVRRDALNWARIAAFLGIVVSFALAWGTAFIPEEFSKYLRTTPVLPLALLYVWWYYERRGSETLDFEKLASGLNKPFEDAILQSARDLNFLTRPMMVTDEEALYTASVTKTSRDTNFLPDDLKRIIPNRAMLISVSTLEEIAKSFLFSRERFDSLLSDLRSRNLLLPRSTPPAVQAGSSLPPAQPQSVSPPQQQPEPEKSA